LRHGCRDIHAYGETMMMQLQEKFRTPRLLLTRIVHEDLGDMLAMHQKPEVARALGGEQARVEVAAFVEKLATQWDRHGFGWWAVREPASGRFIGRGGLRRVTVDGTTEVEIGYALLPEFWNQGLATELCRVSVAQGFVRLGLSEIVGFTPPSNRASRRVLEKTGMRYERDITHGGTPHVLYRLTAASWRSGAPATTTRKAHAPQELVAG
jgi:ribosomal-protein-alanine N-acetyltransferase